MPRAHQTEARGHPRHAPPDLTLPSLHVSRPSRHHRPPGTTEAIPLIVIGRKLLQNYEDSVGVGASTTHLIKSSSRTVASRFSVSVGSPATVEADLASRPTSSSTTSSSSSSSSSSDSPSCATGLSTEHSSIYSWRYDEFDRVNTQRVRQLFCAVDELLYEGKLSSRSEGLQEECRAWNGHSPHLRILGNQLEPPKQEGFQYIHRQASSATRSAVIHTSCLDRREDPSQLCVEGHGLSPGPPAAAHVAPGSRLELSDHSLGLALEEEGAEEEEEEVVYEAEGRLEEFLAYDVKEMEDEGVDQRKACYHAAVLEPSTGRSGGGGAGTGAAGGGGGGGGVPPISPHACIKDAVAGEVFDDAWRLTMRALQGLLQKHWERDPIGGGGLRLPGVSESGGQGLSEPPLQVNTTCRRQAFSRGSNAKMFLGSSFTNNSQGSSAFRVNLNGVMTIQAKPLQQRAQGSADKPLCDSDDRGSVLTGSRTQQAQKSQGGPSQRAQGQRRLPRLSTRTRLLTSSNPLYSNQVLHGTKLGTVSEGLPSPPISAARSHRLPHLTSDGPELDGSLTHPPRHAQPRWRILRGGMSSAVHPRSGLPPLREPTLTLEPLPRPNTTHTVWSDTPMKSSFSTVDFAGSIKPSGHVALPGCAGDLTRMGVTGFSLGITSSSMTSGFSECATPPRRRRTYASSAVEREGPNGAFIIGAQCQRKALGRPPGAARRKFQVVMP
ncbi:hypothetical protein ACEWY4_027182 [Coilia grayii]|uniref:DUF3719 domain-containing protein n=1 Tax=Coilia grayii TaxID=363190 RepID=A0ABD1IRQ0_9TELE